MNNEVQKYTVKHPTNGHQPGAVIELTAAEAENINAGEAEPRVVLAEDQSAPVTAAPEPTGAVSAAPNTYKFLKDHGDMKVGDTISMEQLGDEAALKELLETGVIELVTPGGNGD